MEFELLRYCLGGLLGIFISGQKKQSIDPVAV